ncbi:MAG: type VI-B CRISPR-associated RNA-guided ribonuclease Cas13b [Bacteroidales bacterium]|nr:type VI-B CRISPR-associated RNA-guided ribonuclease Cas13b [Bacteroidales bacterium]
MENNTQTTYYHDKPTDKHYFSNYFNLAQDNIIQVFDEFLSRLNLKKYDKLENKEIKYIEENFSDEISHTDWDIRTQMLLEYFPFIKYLNLSPDNKKFGKIPKTEIENNRRKYFRDNFIRVLKTVDNLRSYYTHYYHEPIEIEDRVLKFIDSTLLKTAIAVKDKKMKSDKTREELKTILAHELKILQSLKKNEFIKNNRNFSDIKLINESIINDAFKHLISTQRTKVFLSDTYKSGNTKNTQIPISQNAIVFLLSMFLSKSQCGKFKDHIEGFKGKTANPERAIDKHWNSYKFMATHWVFSNLCFRGLKRKVNTSLSDITLLNEMIDYLSKVPNQIYNNLDPDKRAQFIEDINEYIQEIDGNNNIKTATTIIHPIIRKRYEEKFNYFVLRFIDEFFDFPSLRFQVTVGKYQHDQRTKDINGTNLKGQRSVVEKINVFEKLNAVINHKSDFFKDKTNETSWLQYPNPCYNIKGNSIYIYVDLPKRFLELTDESCSFREQLRQDGFNNRKNNKPNKSDIIRNIFGDKIRYKQPVALLSLNELPAMLYELLVDEENHTAKTPKAIEGLIIKKVIEQYNRIKVYRPNSNVDKDTLPQKLVKNLQLKGTRWDKLLKDIESEIEKNQSIIDFIKEKKNNNTRFVFNNYELGNYATWITKDLLRFMPNDIRKNWKGHLHSELQRYLALYNYHKTDAYNLLKSVWDIDTDPSAYHIKECFEKECFDQFFEHYLTKRIEILNSFAEKVQNTDKQDTTDIFLFFDKRKYNVKPANELKKEFLAKPVVLPRGVFDNKPTFIPQKNYDEIKHLLPQWLQYVDIENHKFQSFYKLDLSYYNAFRKEKPQYADLRAYEILNLKQFNSYRKKQDLAIKAIQKRDVFLKLMIDYALNTIFKIDFKFSLEKLYLTKDERKENILEAMQQNNRTKGDKSDNIYNSNSVWDTLIEQSLFNGRIKDKVKLKDAGKFRKFETDPKVQTLLSYNKDKIWTKQQLEDELENRSDSYEHIRSRKLLKEIHSLEENILYSYNTENNEHPELLEVKHNPNFRKYICQGIFNKDKLDDKTQDTTEQKALMLINIRNKFAHNQLPPYYIFEKLNRFYPYNADETYSYYFYRVACQIINQLKNHVQETELVH